MPIWDDNEKRLTSLVQITLLKVPFMYKPETSGSNDFCLTNVMQMLRIMKKISKLVVNYFLMSF